MNTFKLNLEIEIPAKISPTKIYSIIARDTALPIDRNILENIR